MFGRLCGCLLLTLLSFPLALLVAGGVFGYWMPVPHPLVFAAGGDGGDGHRPLGAPRDQAGRPHPAEHAAYPVFLLSGVVVPAAELPGPLTAVSRLSYLAWAAELLRDATEPAPVAHALPRLPMVLLLGALLLGIGVAALTRFLRQARELGVLAGDD